MTKKEMYANIATLLADNTEVVEFCNHEVELLDNRKSSGKKSLTATQKANVAVKESIVEALGAIEGGVTVSELITSATALNGYTNQKVSALLRQLIDEGKVVKTIEGKKAYFALAE